MNHKNGEKSQNPRPWELFRVFFGISSLTIGGGYAMVPVIGSALERRGWTTEEEFYELFAVAQSFPGPLALTTAAIAGKNLAGPRGAAAGVAGVILPPFGIIVAVAALLGRFGEEPHLRAFLAGAGATVPGLVAAMLVKLAKGRKWTWVRALETLGLFLALILVPRASLPLFLGGVVILYLLERRWNS